MNTLNTWIWQSKLWPNFTYDTPDMRQIYHSLGQLYMAEKVLSPVDITKISSIVLEKEAFATSALEGDVLHLSNVQASVSKALRLEAHTVSRPTVQIEALLDVLMDTKRTDEPLTAPRLFAWHRALFPLKQSGLHKVTPGLYRDDSKGEVKIVSGTWEKEKVHYLAPPADRVELEMNRFLLWLNTENKMDIVVKSAIAHLWFLLIHPFDDGNRRLARDISDYVLSSSPDIPSNLFTLAFEINTCKKEYYETLDRVCSRDDADITLWINWFIETFQISLTHAIERIDAQKEKAMYWDKIQAIALNGRQRKLVSKALDISNPQVKIHTSLYASLFKVSKPTAARDLKDMKQKGILRSQGAGRGVSYSLKTQ